MHPWIVTRHHCTGRKGGCAIFSTKKEEYLGDCPATKRVHTIVWKVGRILDVYCWPPKNGGCWVVPIIQQRTWTNRNARNHVSSSQSPHAALGAGNAHQDLKKSGEICWSHEISQVWPRTLSMPSSGPIKRPKNLRKSHCGLQWLCVTPARHVDWLASLL